MASQIPALHTFSVESDPRTVAHRWKKYIDSFEIYLGCLGKKNNVEKVNILLHIAGSEVQDIFKTLKPADESYDSALRALEGYFNPTENIRYERSIFMSLQPKDNETVDMFVTRLKKQSAFCKYSELNTEDDFIVDLFINKCRSSELRRKLLETKNLNFKKLLEIARVFEQSQAQNRKIEETYQQVNKNVSSQSNVNRIVQQKANSKGANARNYKTNRPVNHPIKYENKMGHSNPGQGYKQRAPPNQNNTRNECSRCGYEGHHPGDKNKCPGYKSQCNYCGYPGHFTRKCLKKLAKQAEKKNIHSTHVEENVGTEDKYDLLDESFYSFRVKSEYEGRRINCQVRVNNIDVSMQLDTGADLTAIPENIASKIPNLIINKKIKPIMKDYNEQPIKVIGVTKVDVQFREQELIQIPVVIVANDRRPVLGLDWINRFETDWNKVIKAAKTNIIQRGNLLEEFQEIFEPVLGTVKNVTANLELKEDAVPKFMPPRQIPFALKTQVEQEIIRLEKEGNWVKVKYSPWATPLVPVAKPDGGVRLCGDYKITVNPQLKVAQHPLPNPAVMFATMGGCKVFTKIDLKSAFQQLTMDEKSQEICTLNTHLGLYRPKRLPYGVASSPALWQETMDKIFAGLPGVFIFVDDIVVAGEDEEQHEIRLRKVLDRIRENGMKINKNKCLFKVPSVEYLGFIIDGNGIHKTKEKIKAVMETKTQTDVKELQSFLGLVTFYGRFIRDLATIAHPLYHLLNKVKIVENAPFCPTPTGIR